MNTIKAGIDALEDWVKQVVANGTHEDANKHLTIAERLQENVVAIKKGYTICVAVIAEEKI
eukprot:11126324-Ditylum_brightwellii.AAC.1